MSNNNNNGPLQRKRNGSFRRKLIGMIIAQTFLVILIITIANAFTAQAILTRSLEASSDSIIREIDHSITNLINGLRSSTDYFSKDEIIVNYIKTGNGSDQILKSFENFKNSDKNILNVYFGTTAKEMFLYPQTTLSADYDPTSRGWYKGAMATEGVYVESPYVDAVSGAIVFTVAKQIKDSDGTTLGVVGIDVSLASLSEYLNTIVIAQTGYPILVDKDFNILTHKDQALIGKQMPVQAVITELQGNSGKSFTYTYEGIKKIGVYKKLDSIDVYLLSTIPVSDINSNLFFVINSAVIAGFVGIIISAILAYIVAVIITKHIKTIVNGLEKIKNGDLTTVVRVNSNDELGKLADSLNDTVFGIKTIVHEIQTAVDDVNESSKVLSDTANMTRQSAEEVTRTAEEISKGAIDQAEEAESGANMTNTLAKGIDELTESTSYMNELAHNTTQSNTKGIEAVHELSQKTAENDLATNRIEASISELDKKTKEIGNILVTINSIANQTNLLALNASIEAARAGEHGRGFAVVAEEIRKLAEDSRSATEDIQNIVVNIQQDSTQTVAIMEDVKTRSVEQSKAVENVNQTFDTISTNISSISDQIVKINAFMEEMNTQKDNIVMSITNISSISEETAAASEEVTASMEQQTSSTDEVARLANDLNELSGKLRSSITKFKLTE